VLPLENPPAQKRYEGAEERLHNVRQCHFPMKPQVGTGERNQGGNNTGLFIEDLFAEIIYSNNSKSAEEDTDKDKGAVCIFHKEIDESSEHDVQEIAGRVGLVDSNVIVLQGKGKLD